MMTTDRASMATGRANEMTRMLCLVAMHCRVGTSVAVLGILCMCATLRAWAGEPGAVGDLYVTSWLNHKVVQFDGETGALVGDFVTPGSGGLEEPFGLTWGPNGNLFVVSRGRGDVYNGVGEYDGTTGAFVRWFVGPGKTPETGWLSEPLRLTFGPDGNLYVTGSENRAVHKYDGLTGEWLGTFAIGGFSPGGLRFPQDLKFGPKGNLFVISGYCASNPTGEGRGIFEYHHVTGRLVRAFVDDPDIDMAIGAGLLFRPNGNLLLTSTDIDLITGETFRNEVLEFDGTTGELLGAFVPDGSGLDWGTGMTYGPNGNLFVASTKTSSVLEYDGETGTLIGTFASGGGLLCPVDLAFKPAPPEPLPAPTVTGISVSEVDACDGIASVTVTGADLDPAHTIVKLTAVDEPDIVGVVTGGEASEVLQVDFNLGARIAGGTRDVVVRNPDGQMDTLPSALDIVPCYAAVEENLFVLGNRQFATTRWGLFEFDGVSGDLIGFLVEDRSDPAGDDFDLYNSSGFVFGYAGNLLITSCNPGDGSVLEYDGITGRRLGTFIPAGSGGMVRPERLTFGPNGNLFALTLGCSVLEFDGLTGVFVREFVPPGSCGLEWPQDMEFGPNGNLYVTDHWAGLFVFDGQTGECVGGEPLIGPPSDPAGDVMFRALEFCPHSANLVLPWFSEDMPPGEGLGRVTEHAPQTGELLRTPIPPPAGGLTHAKASDFGPNGHLFVAGYPDHVFEYDLVSGEVCGIFASQNISSGGAASEIMFGPLGGDADGDWDRDLGDFAPFQGCFSGDGVTPGDCNCLVFDNDRDGDVDLDDLAAFAAAMTGPE